MMNVFINAISARLGGGQTYIVNLLQYLPDHMDVKITIAGPDTLNIPAKYSCVERLEIDKRYIENTFFRSFWEKYKLPGILSKHQADILFCPGGLVNTVPPSGCKTVTMFRNMLPFDPVQVRKYSGLYDRIRLWILKRAFLKSFIRADLVIFISEFAKQVIDEHVGNSLKRSIVIPHGINEKFRVVDNLNLDRPEWLPEEEYLLYVSTFEPYKGHIQVLRGFSLLKKERKTNEKLIFIGGKDSSEYGISVRNEIKNLGLEGEALVIGEIPYEDLPAVYQHAKMNIFASECENCPNILLEALASAKPLIVSNRPPMPEFGGEAVIYFDPSSPTDFAQKLKAVIDNSDLMTELSNKSLKQSMKYKWSNSAVQTWEEIYKLYQLKSGNKN
ncbi:MAG: glycosyltransferase family 4 protein [Bacillota bacterium]